MAQEDSPYVRVGAYALCTDEDERLLLARARDGATGQWTLPGGGLDWVDGELRPEAEGTTDTCAWFTPGEVQSLPLTPLGEFAIALAWPAGGGRASGEVTQARIEG